jgi:alpha-mannosidase
LPFGTFGKKSAAALSAKKGRLGSIIEIAPANVRLLALKRSWDGRTLVVRMQETLGKRTSGRIKIAGPGDIRAEFRPFEIVTLRIDRAGGIREIGPLEEA